MIPDHTKNQVLREKAVTIPVPNISSKTIQNIITKMNKALDKESDGVALAAPQIGESLSMFIVSGKIFDQSWAEGKESLVGEHKNLVFINPKITKRSKKMKNLIEGCLSVRWLYGEVKRHTNVTLEAYNEKGERIFRGAGGLLAQIFQHETDHLSGILFIDKATDLKELPPNE